MPSSLQTLLKQIESGKPPSVILVGGNSEYLVDAAWDDIRAAFEK